MRNRGPMRRHRESEDGFLLLAVMFMLFLMTIALSVAIPDVTKSLQRQKELETMQRGKQYIRAIQLYYRKFGSYPPSIDALVKTNNIRFLRKRYKDPLTGKDDWKLIHFGQNKAPLAMGFFGQPLGGLTGSGPIAGTGPSGGNGMSGMGAQPGMGQGFGSTGSTGSTPGGGGIFGGSAAQNNTQSNAMNTGTTGSNPGAGDQNGGTGSDSGMNSGSGFMSGQNGSTFGGGIIGVEPPVDKESILIYKKKQRYNQWEFTYSPLQDQMKQAGAMGMGGTANTGLPNGLSNGSNTTPGSNDMTGGPSNPFTGSGNSFGGSGNSFGGSGSFGGGGSAPSSPNQPQQ